MPSHTSTVYLPDGRVIGFTCHPIGRFKGKHTCKYCYKTHRDWWQMKDEDYGAPVALCGKCEHTTLIENLES